MSVTMGIIGLDKSGRTTLFQALTKGEAGMGRHAPESLVPPMGVAKVAEPRLKVLADMLHPKRVVPASVTYIDVGASVKGLVMEKGISGQLLAQLSQLDALIYVVRAFSDESIPHVAGSVDVERDITTMDLELTFSDLALIERRLDKLGVSLKGAKPPERPGLLREQELLIKIKSDLEKNAAVRELVLTAEESRTTTNYQFLTAKPLLIIVNIGEERLSQAESLVAELSSRYSRRKCRLTALCGKLEMELAQLEDSEAETLRADFGLKESGVEHITKLSYELLGLISFFTIVSAEVRAWSVPRGTEAVKAAGKIHSDMERGFIRAEVISYDNLVKCGSLAEARKRGLLLLEGKNYIVQDGDVITFLFNV